MSWSDFKEFNEENVKLIPQNIKGIYRIAFFDEKEVFKVDEKKINGKFTKVWKGIFALKDINLQEQFLSEILADKFDGVVYTNLVYIGKSEQRGGIRGRLLEHLSKPKTKKTKGTKTKKTQGNEGILRLLKHKIKLRFSYLSSENPIKAEKSFYEEFIKKTTYSPPCDRDSLENKKFHGKHLYSYLCKSNGKIVREYSLLKEKQAKEKEKN